MKTKYCYLIIITLMFNIMSAYSQQKTPSSFSTEEFEFCDTILFEKLKLKLCHDTVLGLTESTIKYFAFEFDSSMAYINPITGKHIIANLRVTELVDGSQILLSTNTGKDVIGHFYLEKSIVFLLNTTNSAFIAKYLKSIGKQKQFCFFESLPSVGGGRDAFLYVTESSEVIIVEILNYE